MQRFIRFVVVVIFAVTTSIVTAPAAAPILVGDGGVCVAVGSHDLYKAVTAEMPYGPCHRVMAQAQICQHKCGWGTPRYGDNYAIARGRFTNAGYHCGWDTRWRGGCGVS